MNMINKYAFSVILAVVVYSVALWLKRLDYVLRFASVSVLFMAAFYCQVWYTLRRMRSAIDSTPPLELFMFVQGKSQKLLDMYPALGFMLTVVAAIIVGYGYSFGYTGVILVGVIPVWFAFDMLVIAATVDYIKKT